MQTKISLAFDAFPREAGGEVFFKTRKIKASFKTSLSLTSALKIRTFLSQAT